MLCSFFPRMSWGETEEGLLLQSADMAEACFDVRRFCCADPAGRFESAIS